jgi:hypothetical protein
MLSFCILWDPKYNNRVHNSPPTEPILNQINPVHAIHPISRRSILILSSHYKPRSSKWFPSFGFHHQTLYRPLLPPIRATCPAHLILLYVITRILREEYWSWRSSVCNFLQSAVPSSLIHSHVFLSTLLCLTQRVFLNVTDQVWHPYNRPEKL